MKAPTKQELQPDNQLFTRGPDAQVIGHIAAKLDGVDLVSEGEIRAEERGYLDFTPTRPYHDRVSSWMFNLQYSRSTKQQLVCQRCGTAFEGRKGQVYCSVDCRKGKTRKQEKNEYGCDCWDFECEKCKQMFAIFLQLRLEYLLQKHGVEELVSGMNLDVAEDKRLRDLAVYMVKQQ
jgi:hypothetical protein